MFFADVAGCRAKNRQKPTHDRHVTSRCRIFTKSSENIYYINILFVSKFEVICIIKTEVVANYVFLGSIWEYIGNHGVTLSSSIIISVLGVVWS